MSPRRAAQPNWGPCAPGPAPRLAPARPAPRWDQAPQQLWRPTAHLEAGKDPPLGPSDSPHPRGHSFLVRATPGVSFRFQQENAPRPAPSPPTPQQKAERLVPAPSAVNVSRHQRGTTAARSWVAAGLQEPVSIHSANVPEHLPRAGSRPWALSNKQKKQNSLPSWSSQFRAVIQQTRLKCQKVMGIRREEREGEGQRAWRRGWLWQSSILG